MSAALLLEVCRPSHWILYTRFVQMHQALHTCTSSYSLVYLHSCCVSGLCGSCSPLSWLQIFKGVFFQSCPLHFVSNVLPHAIMHLTPDNCFHSIPLVWSQLVLVLQTVICRFVFFEDQKGSFIAIKNRSILFVSLVPFECISATYLLHYTVHAHNLQYCLSLHALAGDCSTGLPTSSSSTTA